MLKVVKYGLIVFMALCAVYVGGLWLFEHFESPSKEEDKARIEREFESVDEEVETAPEEEYVPDSSVMIAKEHGFLNKIVGYEQVVDIDSEKDRLEMIRDEMQEQADHAHDKNMKQDFKNVVGLINYGLKNNDTDSIIYAHRILHDLDMNVNGYVGSASDVHRYGFSKFDNGEYVETIDHKLQDAE